MRFNKILSIIVISILLATLYLPLVGSIEQIKHESNTKIESGTDEDFSLLHAEHYLYIDATEDVGQFNIKYTFPAEYKGQYPLYLEIVDDSNANILNYNIENDINEPNKVVNFTIGEMNKNDRSLIHMKYWVIVKNYNYSDFPKDIKIPKENDLPADTKKWLSSTEVVQKDRFLLKLRARQMKLFTDNLVKLAERIGKFCKNHRYLIFYIQYLFGLYQSQDALTTLFLNGECPGRSHLGSALFRANGVPARVILSCPVKYNFWFEMHYMVEYYTNEEYDWILSDVHSGASPIERKNQIIHRICYPEDENDTQHDFINKKMDCIEKWFWINNDFIKPYYKDLDEGSKSRGYFDNEMIVNSFDSDWTIVLTKEVYSYYENYLGTTLYGENQEYFANATSYQKKAIELFKDSTDPYGYLWYMHLANEEYKKIMI